MPGPRRPVGELPLGGAARVHGAVVPWALHRRSLARLRRRAAPVIDLSQPGDYRNGPAMAARREHPAAALRSAAPRYGARLARSFALVAPWRSSRGRTWGGMFRSPPA